MKFIRTLPTHQDGSRDKLQHQASLGRYELGGKRKFPPNVFHSLGDEKSSLFERFINAYTIDVSRMPMTRFHEMKRLRLTCASVFVSYWTNASHVATINYQPGAYWGTV